jgi:hypothetical protein
MACECTRDRGSSSADDMFGAYLPSDQGLRSRLNLVPYVPRSPRRVGHGRGILFFWSAGGLVSADLTMKTQRAILLFVMAALVRCALTSVASRPDERPLAEKSYRAVDGSFGALLFLTSDADAFVDQWRNATSTTTLSVVSVSRLQQGAILTAFIVFGGCTADVNSRCNTSVDYELVGPGGESIAKRSKLVLWQDPPPPLGYLQLAPASFRVQMDKTDPTGIYRIRAAIRDSVAARQVTVERAFMLSKAALGGE